MPNLTSVGLTAGAATSGTGTVSTLDNLIGTAGTGSAQVLTVQGSASGTAQPVSAASLPLPSGAATAAKQPALGTAGSASTDVITVQGIASGTAQPVTLASTTITGTAAVTQSGTWTVQPGNTANTTAWKVDGSAVTQPISNTALTNINTALGSTALDLGVGTGGSRTLRVAVDSAQTEGSAYETVAASQSNQVMGSTGAIGDYLSHVVVSPGTAGCGVVTILDNATTVVAFPGGGTTALSNLIPFVIPVGITSTSGAWKITTGANVTCVAVGRFT